jgi:hypothetical protein
MAFRQIFKNGTCVFESRRPPHSNLVVWPRFSFAPGDFVPHALVDVIQENFREQLHAADCERPLQFPCDEKSNDQRVQAASETPRNRLGETAIMFFSHAES